VIPSRITPIARDSRVVASSPTQSALRGISLFYVTHSLSGHLLAPRLHLQHSSHFCIRMRPHRRSISVEWGQ
jgi:hypothetical protein